MTGRVGTRWLGRLGLAPAGKRNGAAECGLTRRLPGGARGAPAEEVRVPGRAAASEAGGLPAGRPPPSSPGRLDYMAPGLGRGGAGAQPGLSWTLARSRGTEPGAYCWLVGLEAGRVLQGLQG